MVIDLIVYELPYEIFAKRPKVHFTFTFYALFQTFKNNGQSEIKRKTNSTLAEVNGPCKDEIAAQGGYWQSQLNFIQPMTCWFSPDII